MPGPVRMWFGVSVEDGFEFIFTFFGVEFVERGIQPVFDGLEPLEYFLPTADRSSDLGFVSREYFFAAHFLFPFCL
jgi:hypothetical protein